MRCPLCWLLSLSPLDVLTCGLNLWRASVEIAVLEVWKRAGGPTR